MGYLLEFDSVNHALRVRFERELTEDLLWESYKDGKRHTPPDTRGAIFDLLAVTSIQVDAAAMQELANLPPIINDPPDIATFLAHIMTGSGKRVKRTADSRIVAGFAL